MATVYLAEDLKHQRNVALKVLHPEIGVSLGVERFLAEIRTTANLQHPNILPLYDSGAADKLVYYVMPFIEGETIRDRMTREGPLPVGETIRIVQGAAAALDYAHRHGIIHRDIKPENILLQDGQALVADFGVALAVKNAASARITQTGLSVGTPAYMSPEQAAAERNLDGRSDVYSLAAVMYEMLTGEAPFTGKNSAQVMSRMMVDVPPSVHTRRSSVPPYVSDAIDRALEKVPGDRQSTAAEFSDALERPSTSTYRATVRAARTRGRELMYVGAAVAMGVVGWYAGRKAAQAGGAGSQPPSRLVLQSERFVGKPSYQRQIAITPDGGAVLFGYRDAAGQDHWVRQSLDGVAAPLTGSLPSYQAGNFVVAPDGRWFVYTSDGQVYRQSMVGGAPERLPIATLSTIDDRGRIWFQNGDKELGYLDADAKPVRVKLPVANLQLLQVLTGERSALVRSQANAASSALLLLDLANGKTSTLVAAGVADAYYAAGVLTFVRQDGTLASVPFDAHNGTMVGTPVEIASGVSTGANSGQLAVSRNGIVAYVATGPRSLVFVNRDGVVRPAAARQAAYHKPRFSPDGRRVAVDIFDNVTRDGWILDVATGTMSRVTFENDGHDLIFSPDGREITFLSAKSGALGLYRKRADGSTGSDSLFASPHLMNPAAWFRDGDALLVDASNLADKSGFDIGIVRHAGRGPLEPVLASPYQEGYASLSPDQRWLAFASNQSGRQEVYVRPFGRDGEQVPVSVDGGSEPVWSKDGRELFYRAAGKGNPMIFVASVATSPTLSVQSRKALFSVADMEQSSPHANYDVSPDGRTFVMVRTTPGESNIVIIQNLPALVKKLQGATAAAR